MERQAGQLAIVAPGGQRTELTVNADGWLTGFAPPEGSATTATYQPNGLMETFTDARGGVHEFLYDASGLLTRDEDPAGGVTTLVRSAVPRGYRVTRTTERDGGPDLTQLYEARGLPAGGAVVRSTDTAGGLTEVESRPDGTQTAMYPDGAQIDSETGPDPRWDFYVPALVSLRLETPDGRTRATTATRQRAAVRPARSVQLHHAHLHDDHERAHHDPHVRPRDAPHDDRRRPSGRQQASVVDAQGRLTRAERGPGPRTAGRSRATPAGAPRRCTRDRTPGPTSTTPPTGCSPASTPRTGGPSTTATASAATTLLRSPGAASTASATTPAGSATRSTMPGGATHELAFDAADRLQRFTPSGSASSWRSSASRTAGSRRRRSRAAARSPTPATPRAAHGAVLRHQRGELRLRRRHAAAGDGRLVAVTRRDRTRSSPTRGTATSRRASPPPASPRVATTTPTTPTCACPRRSSRAGRASSRPRTRATRTAWSPRSGPYTLTRSGPGASVSAISDGTLAMTIGRDAQGDLAARAQTVAGEAVYDEQLDARRRRAHHAQGRDGRRRRRRRSTTSTTPTGGC